MATAICTSNTVAQTLVTVDRTHRVKITGITIDNQSAASRTIVFTDVFTPDASVGTPSPGAQTITRKQVTVGTLLTATLEEKDLKDVDVFGVFKGTGDAIQATCVITISYHEE